MNGYALDANIISFLLRKNNELQKRVYYEAKNGGGIIIPAIAYYEVKRGLINSRATIKLAAFERLCDMVGIGEIDIETLDKAANIYSVLKRIGRLIEDADILLAAACIVHGYTLVTDNAAHLGRVDGLQFENWV